MKVFNKEGKEMIHPQDYADMVNDSIYGAIDLKNYKMDYYEAEEKENLLSGLSEIRTDYEGSNLTLHKYLKIIAVDAYIRIANS